MERLFLMFLDHTQPRSTVGRTPLDEWSARRRDLYLTTHDTHNRQISMWVCAVNTFSAVSATLWCHIKHLNPELNPVCYLLALLAHHFLHVSRIRVKSLTLRLLMSYIYIYIYDLSRRAACGRSPAEIVGSNPTGGMDICLLWVSCVVR